MIDNRPSSSRGLTANQWAGEAELGKEIATLPKGVPNKKGVENVFNVHHQWKDSQRRTSLTEGNERMDSPSNDASNKNELVTVGDAALKAHDSKEAAPVNGTDKGLDTPPAVNSSQLDPHSSDFNYGEWLRNMLYERGEFHKGIIGVAYRNLNAYGFGTQTDYQKTFANYPLTYLSRLGTFFRQQRKSRISILQDFDGLVGSGEMLVVLGRPGSGCSTLLKTLAGQTYSFHIDDKSTINYQGNNRVYLVLYKSVG